jgi:pyridoxamine 5'-phosphate oxidase
MSEVSADLADLRRDFSSRPLRRGDMAPDPVQQFDDWFREALAANVIDANAMSVATCDAHGQPASRMVLLKYYDAAGFVFYTNLESRKAGEISGNARVALLFFWPELRRQVRIEGEAAQVPVADTLRYFLRRPRDSQIGAWVSAQSSVISTRAVLEQKFAELQARFGRGEVPLPSFWGGYRVRPAMIEFWQGRENRLHDRFRYRREAGESWQVERLAP